MHRPLTLVFDLDGTLVDTAPDLIGTLAWLLEAEGLSPVDLARARDLIGHGMRPMVEKAMKEQGRGEDKAEVDAVFARYLVAYEARIARESRPYPGLVASLDRLVSQGFRLAVCTNKTQRLAVKLLDELGLARRFAFIAGADTYPVRKPDPGHILMTLTDAGGDPARAIMIGDSETDIRAAQAAKIPVIAFSVGYTAIPLAELGPDVILDHYDGLDAAVARLLP